MTKDAPAAEANAHLPQALPGLFITFEGIDGAGKSTQCALVSRGLSLLGRQVVELREPGGTRLGEGIRKLLLDPSSLDEGASMNPFAELFLYEAARAQLVDQVVRPALLAGKAVVSDRFCDSTVAYQGVARNLGVDVTRTLNRLACAEIAPARTLVFDLAPSLALARAIKSHGGSPDRLESEGVSFENAVRKGMLACAAAEPERIRVIDANGSVEEVYGRVRKELLDIVALPDYDAVRYADAAQGR
jgi:dTMP kinase